MTLVIALQACILILKMPIDVYDGWVSIIVYPARFSPKREVVDEFGVRHTVQSSLAGEAWLRGPVVLAWNETAHAGVIDGHNLVIHEFAHKLDMQTGSANGFPPLHSGLTRYFRYYIPSQLKPNPDVVLLFHGGTQSMRKIMRKRAGGTQEWQSLAEKNGFLLLLPNGVNVKTGNTKGDKQNWNDCRVGVKGNNSASTADGVGFIDQLLDWSVLNFKINESRVYVTGASNGGMMSLRLITELSNRVTAAAVFIAHQPEKTDCTKPRKPVPLLMMSATDDPLMLWKGGQIRGDGPVMMSATDTLEYWLQVNKADKKKQRSRQLADVNKKDDSIILQTIYPEKIGGQPVWFYKIQGAGHTMPSKKHKVPFIARLLIGSQNKDLEATHEAWRFLQQFSQ